MREALTLPLKPPKRGLPNIETVCPRKNCGMLLTPDMGPQDRRRVGMLHVCRRCYQTTWELAKKKEITLEEAWKIIPSKGWKPPKADPVLCVMPWCFSVTRPNLKRKVTENAYTCGPCTAWLKGIACHRFKGNKTWQELALAAIKGNLARPHEPELCVMPWCGKIEITHRRGPNGEAICNTDGVYLFLYARRHGLTFEKAFRSAPRPLKRGPARQ